MTTRGFRARRPLVRQKSLRERLLDSERSLNFMAAAADKPPVSFDIPEKRKYTKRTDGSSEHEQQKLVIDWWDAACGTYGLPHFALFAVPNGAHLASGYIGASKLKAEGMRPGALDLILAVPRDQFHGLLIEMKYGSNKPSDDQKTFVSYLLGAGYCASVQWSADSAIAAIKEYLA